ncbi:Sugar-specific transcriptional regulator TrmB [Haladaptatus litoreus]|uniref:Sugar-specific transcriptional regulator TrmB n=1 Tax=Haladaptatus litoreus TaxID=553468 RepID=A0A1N7F256_9EURY|nr:helix-turn-helix domain-containing protein [Haladaptatus litoreus]SIR94448.1 Sugar-specific transcriptional regulator TrmB [Haladaptatus litoreus]
MAQSAASTDSIPIAQLQTVVELLENPTLARIYTYALRSDGATVADFVTELDIPQGTAYDYVRKLEAAGLLTKQEDNRPYEFEAEPLSLTLTTDGETRTITDELVDAAAQRTENEDIDVYIDRHGIDGLATALEYAGEFVEGTVNHRIMARELDLSPLEAEIILQALEPVIRAHSDDE